MIDEDLDKKLRILQAKRIIKSNETVSFSEIVNETLRQALE